MTADGQLFACLFSHAGVDLRAALRSGSDLPGLERIICDAIWDKPAGFIERSANRPVGMHVLGG
jgi:molybdenum cofactor biosynthesis enzyme MoaA